MTCLHTLLTLVLLGTSSTVVAGGVAGQYAAVTESEAVIELDLIADYTAKLKTGYLPVEPEEKFEPHVRYGRWVENDGVVEVTIKGLGALRYKAIEALSYAEFGGRGASFGLSPMPPTEDPFNRYGLWRKRDLKKHFGK